MRVIRLLPFLLQLNYKPAPSPRQPAVLVPLGGGLMDWPVKLFVPLHQIALAAVFLDQPVNVIHASAARLPARQIGSGGAYDAAHSRISNSNASVG
jgi:hypothetical protein